MSDDDEVRSALREAGGWAEREARLHGPGRARQRSRTRSAAAVAGTAALTVLALVGAVLGVGRLSGDESPGVVPAAPPSATAVVPVTIPEDFDLGLEEPPGVPVHTVRPVDVVPVDVCPGEGIPGVDAAADRRFTWRTGPGSGQARGVLVFTDAGGAVGFMSGLRSAADRCAAGAPLATGGTRAIVQAPLAGAWGEGVTLLLLDVPDTGGVFTQEPIYATYLFAARTGSAVALYVDVDEHFRFTDLPTAPPADLVALYRRPLDAMAPRLCTWTVAGC